MNTRITGTGYSLPAFRADNDYLATLVETSDEWITERTGIRARHLAGEETTVSMAAAAAEKALKRAGADPSEVELRGNYQRRYSNTKYGMPGTGTDRSRQGSGI